MSLFVETQNMNNIAGWLKENEKCLNITILNITISLNFLHDVLCKFLYSMLHTSWNFDTKFLNYSHESHKKFYLRYIYKLSILRSIFRFFPANEWKLAKKRSEGKV